ncbi:auxin response factor 17-like [Cucurbita pepo subsp. pepo]|uniref:auxin response factor 17-like n=1 Tax=Cucurbita pepo subsp. pepo TaxID=3664 RepID=UPI000C9D2943|nr:auxin response factor 17-like [Cucurbita pepo subsp. pepo]
MDPKLWRAFAGDLAHLHTVGSEVYYFVQGHVEQATYAPKLSPAVLSNPVSKCLVTGVGLDADALTDEVLIKINLHPIRPGEGRSEVVSRLGCSEVNVISKFAKVLTSSDANNGGGFSVPRYCAVSIFPPLNFQADPPVQTLAITDVHGVVWKFRHIYRGTPRRHLLTTGWSKFVNHKKLIAGDSVVFAKNSRGEMFVGIRRARSNRPFTSGECSRVEENPSGDGDPRNFSRRTIGRVPPEVVATAAELAAQFKPFEVVFYPRIGLSQFVVPVEIVNNSMKYQWYPGIRVKLPTETEDTLRTQWHQGTIISVSIPEHDPWKGSPWRMLEITWEETDAPPNGKYVCPWEVELAGPAPPIQPSLHIAKRPRGHSKSGQLNGEAELFSPMMRVGDSSMEQFNQALLSFNSFPAGMQGARQNFLCESGLFDNPYKETTNAEPSTQMVSQVVSTDLHIGSAQSDTLSPDSQASVLSFATESADNQLSNSTEAGVTSFQLFGQIIHLNPPPENGANTDDVDMTSNQSD